MDKKLIKKILKSEIVSFDVFDTLIYRMTKSPIGIFYLVENAYNNRSKNKCNDFVSQRIRAEKIARKLSSIEEVSLQEIYAQLPYGINDKNVLRKLEEDLEIQMTLQNTKAKEIFDFCMEHRKKILIISDMYLSHEVIKKILEKCEYKGEYSLNVSSEYGVRKRHGKLFDKIEEKYKLNRRKWLHIGDDLLADVIQPNRRGIGTYRLRISKQKGLKNNEIYNIVLRILLQNMPHKINKYWEIGYRNYGVLLYGYVMWLHKIRLEYNDEQILFVARDGYIIKKAYEIIFGEDDCKTVYFYASRKSIMGNILKEDYSAENLLRNGHLRTVMNIGQFLDRFNIRIDECKDRIERVGLKEDYLIKSNSYLDDNFNRFILEIREVLQKNFLEQSTYFKSYVRDNISKKRILIADVGWHGTIQKAIEDCCNENIVHGAYIGIEKSVYINHCTMHGYLMNEKTDKKTNMKVKAIRGLIEIFFSAPHGSVSSYEKIDGKLKIVFEPYEHENYPSDDTALHELWKGALQALEILNRYRIYELFDIKPEVIIDFLFDLCVNSDSLTQCLIGDLRFQEGKVSYVAKPTTLSSYMKNPKKLLSDFGESIWKIGFLKRLLRIKLPYFTIYKTLLKSSEK